MWFWSGKTVKETEISDITAYNHANGIMWIVYSIIYWMATFAGIWNSIAALGPDHSRLCNWDSGAGSCI